MFDGSRASKSRRSRVGTRCLLRWNKPSILATEDAEPSCGLEPQTPSLPFGGQGDRRKPVATVCKSSSHFRLRCFPSGFIPFRPLCSTTAPHLFSAQKTAGSQMRISLEAAWRVGARSKDRLSPLVVGDVVVECVAGDFRKSLPLGGRDAFECCTGAFGDTYADLGGRALAGFAADSWTTA